MEITSPNRSDGSLEPSESVILTPFKERALEEQRIRDNLILSLTPGLKRQSEVQASVAPLNNDIVEIQSYLRDLSSALASRGGGKNLTSQLLSHTVGQDSSASFNNNHGNDNNPELFNTEIQDSSFNIRVNTFNNADDSLLGQEIRELNELTQETPSDEPVPQSRLDTDYVGHNVIESPSNGNNTKSIEVEIEQDNSPMTLSQQILSRIPKQRSGAKIRKLEPVRIGGIMAPSTTNNIDLRKDTVKNPFVTESHPRLEPEPELDPIPFNDKDKLETFDIDMEPSLPHIPESPESDTHKNYISNPISKYEESPQREFNIPDSPHFENNDVFEEPTIQADIKPIGIRQLHDLFDNFLILSNIKLKNKSWKALQEASSQLLKQFTTNLDNGNGLIVPKRTKIIDMLQKYDVVSLNASESEIYRLCSPYLTIEEMNELEMEWFGMVDSLR
ncbi:similar to Saccharomyces cerevisiae YFR046C CNN1 Kinetochore protein of unknown function [Maudiozyma barnettii]|uniref:Uncharacterized protein n=1 Tax=Maudiozyma barnettii TaxID=61262 RepID=A0A8H2VIC4_9SACH|nr:centromere-binding protein CNN1 [Kazachstania barnettii]CAB4256226.1 similar to Saccharomyces cerevisiae YFR046C CNN1 Kinetochore protein of unknown function [Kazachstania barnettii]CAD1784835.1 similar to Saccharomyces cerevisiae YFR046C CNN1 Kinetochore protein of unknown function [Kazachstania barnettii]